MAGGFTLNPLDATKQLWNDYTGVTANEMNSAQAQRQMDFQERMSNTAYQRATKDMSSAGLNPMLAYSQGGASTPAGASANMQRASSAEAVIGLMSKFADIFQTQSQTAVNWAQRPGVTATSGIAEAELEKVGYELKDLRYQYENVFETYKDRETGEDRMGEHSWITRARGKLLSDIQGNKRELLEQKIMDIGLQLKKLGLPEAEAEAWLYRNGGEWLKGIEKLGGIVSNILGRIFRFGSSAAAITGKSVLPRTGPRSGGGWAPPVRKGWDKVPNKDGYYFHDLRR